MPSPIMRAMADGTLARVEELTRMPADVQDALITILSEKTLPVPELGIEVQARKGFNLIEVDPYYQSIAQGAIILLAIAADPA